MVPGLEGLQREKFAFQSQAYAANTATTRGVQTRRYLEFVEAFSETVAPLPCPGTQVALYATWLAMTLKYSSVLNYLSGLNNFLKQRGEPPIVYSEFELASTLRGIRRARAAPPRQAVPLLPGALLKMLSLLTNSPGHTAWRAAVLCSFRALLRKCQITLSDSALLRRDFVSSPGV